MQRNRHKTAIALFLICLDFQVSAQELSKSKAHNNLPNKNKTIQAQEPSTAPVTAPAPTFSPVFWGDGKSAKEYEKNDPQKVVEWVQQQIASVPGKTDQFSTREERDAYNTALKEKMGAIPTIPFVTGCTRKYDADREIWEVKKPLFAIKDLLLRNPDPEQNRLRKFAVAQLNMQKDTYTAQNGFGAITEVIRTKFDEIALVYPSNEEPSIPTVSGSSSTITLPYRYSFFYYTTSIPMPPAEARTTERQIACVGALKLQPPYIFKYKERDTPTRNVPMETDVNGIGLYGELDRYLVINKESGTVYASFAIQH